MRISGAVSAYNGAITYAHSGCCPACPTAMPPIQDCAAEYFNHHKVSCINCGSLVDIWETALSDALDSAGLFALTPIGTRTTSFKAPILLGRAHGVDLRHFDIPGDARVIDVSYTTACEDPRSALTALPVVNTSLEKWANGTQFRYVGVSYPHVTETMDHACIPTVNSELHVAVVWLPKVQSLSWPYLVNAFEAFTSGNYGPALVSAQSAVEIYLMPILRNSTFTRHPLPQALKKKDLSYGNALKHFLPHYAAVLGFKEMPPSAANAVLDLKDIRNRIIHDGLPPRLIPRAKAIEGLAASVFALEYLQFIERKLLS